jgi:hypothetical protein
MIVVVSLGMSGRGGASSIFKGLGVTERRRERGVKAEPEHDPYPGTEDRRVWSLHGGVRTGQIFLRSYRFAEQ